MKRHAVREFISARSSDQTQMIFYDNHLQIIGDLANNVISLQSIRLKIYKIKERKILFHLCYLNFEHWIIFVIIKREFKHEVGVQ